MGESYNKTEHYAEAIECFKRALQLEPDRADSLSELGFAYSRLGRDQDAVESCKEAVRLKPDLSEAYNNLGIAYFKLGQRAEAIESLEQPSASNPTAQSSITTWAMCTLMRAESMTQLLHINRRYSASLITPWLLTTLAGPLAHLAITALPLNLCSERPSLDQVRPRLTTISDMFTARQVDRSRPL